MDDADRAYPSIRFSLRVVESSCSRLLVQGRSLYWRNAAWNVTEVDRENDAVFLEPV